MSSTARAWLIVVVCWVAAVLVGFGVMRYDDAQADKQADSNAEQMIDVLCPPSDPC